MVKGRAVNAFHLPLTVSNYPMRERTKAERDELQFVTTQRKIEQAEQQASQASNTPVVGKRLTVPPHVQYAPNPK